MAVTGALFALFVAATTFTLVLRAFGTDRLPMRGSRRCRAGRRVRSPRAAAARTLCLRARRLRDHLRRIPVVMPPLLIQAPDAVWVAVLALLACRRASSSRRSATP